MTRLWYSFSFANALHITRPWTKYRNITPLYIGAVLDYIWDPKFTVCVYGCLHLTALGHQHVHNTDCKFIHHCFHFFCLLNVSNPFPLIRRYFSKQPKRNLAALRALRSSQVTQKQYPSTLPWVPSHVVIPSGQIADAAKCQRTHIGVARSGDFSPVLHAMTSWDDYDSNMVHGVVSPRCRYDMNACDISSNMNR